MLKLGTINQRPIQVLTIPMKSDSAEAIQKVSQNLEEVKQLIHKNVLVFDYSKYDMLNSCYELAFPHRNSSLKDYCQSLPVDANRHDVVKQLLTGMAYLSEKGIHSIHLNPEGIHMFIKDNFYPELRLSFNFEANLLKSFDI